MAEKKWAKFRKNNKYKIFLLTEFKLIMLGRIVGVVRNLGLRLYPLNLIWVMPAKGCNTKLDFTLLTFLFISTTTLSIGE